MKARSEEHRYASVLPNYMKIEPGDELNHRAKLVAGLPQELRTFLFESILRRIRPNPEHDSYSDDIARQLDPSTKQALESKNFLELIDKLGELKALIDKYGVKTEKASGRSYANPADPRNHDQQVKDPILEQQILNSILSSGDISGAIAGFAMENLQQDQSASAGSSRDKFF